MPWRYNQALLYYFTWILEWTSKYEIQKIRCWSNREQAVCASVSGFCKLLSSSFTLGNIMILWFIFLIVTYPQPLKFTESCFSSGSPLICVVVPNSVSEVLGRIYSQWPLPGYDWSYISHAVFSHRRHWVCVFSFREVMIALLFQTSIVIF